MPGLVFGICTVLAGAMLLCYPTVADWWNGRKSTHVVEAYEADVAEADDLSGELEAAETWNRMIASGPFPRELTEKERAAYETVLDVSSTGVMGSVQIPKLSLTLPIYHGTGDAALAAGAGHLEGTSLPIGGTGTHAVISGHTGLASRDLFTGLTELESGDPFLIRVLDRQLVYEITEIRTVLPDEVDALELDPDLDQVTLLTCTPIGKNTHRLLVTGVRSTDAEITSYDVQSGDETALMVLFGLNLGLFLVQVLWKKRKR